MNEPALFYIGYLQFPSYDGGTMEVAHGTDLDYVKRETRAEAKKGSEPDSIVIACMTVEPISMPRGWWEWHKGKGWRKGAR